jgi:hypothetical protein
MKPTFQSCKSQSLQYRFYDIFFSFFAKKNLKKNFFQEKTKKKEKKEKRIHKTKKTKKNKKTSNIVERN